jgi:type I restriction enzyme, S subunit
MSNGWHTFRLDQLVVNPKSDIVDGPFGSNLKASEYIESGVPIARLQNVNPNVFVRKNIRFVSEEKATELSRHNFKGGDLLITKLGDPLGEACIVPADIERGVIVADLVRVRLDPKRCVKAAVCYAINSTLAQAQFKRETKGTTRPRVNLGMVRSLRLPLPKSLDEQQRIVTEIEKQFTRLDAGLMSLKRVQTALKRYRTSVLKAASDGWPAVPLSNVCDVISGFAFKSSDFVNQGIPVVKIANVSYGVYLDEFPSFLPHTFLSEFRRF